MTARAEVAGTWRLLLERNFGSLWLGQAVSGFGDRITLIALAFLTWQLTQSSLFTALAVLITTVPHAIFGFFAGPIADALGPRRTMIAADLVRAVVIGAIPIAMALQLPLGVAYGFALVATLCASLFNPSRLALVPSLVTRKQLGAGNSLIFTSDKTVEIVGYAAAGVLVERIGVLAFYVDAATFLFSALMLRRIALPAELRRGITFAEVLRDAGTGLHVIRTSAVLFWNTVVSLVAQMSVAVTLALAPVFVFRELRGGPDAYGASEAAIAVGAAIFAPAMPALMTMVRKGRLVVAGFAAYGLILVALSLSPTIWTAIIFFALGGMANIVFLIANVTISQEHTPPELRARVFSTRFALLNLTWLPVMAVSGALGDVVGAGTLIGIAGLLTLATAAVAAFLPAVRDVE